MSALSEMTTTLTAQVRGEDLLKAIGAVVPHTGKESDGGGVERIRVCLDTGLMRLALVATNGGSAIVAVLPLLEADETFDPAGERVEWMDVDLTKDAVKAISAVLKSSDPDLLRLDVTSRSVQVTDVSGLLAGRTIRVQAQPEWFSDEDTDRVDGAALVLETCAEPLSARASVMLPESALRPWMATARVLGGLPLRVTTEGHAVVAFGALDDLAGLTVLGSMTVLGASADGGWGPAYTGPGVGALMDLLLDGTPVGGEPARERESALVTEIQEWMREQHADGGEGPEGGDAA